MKSSLWLANSGSVFLMSSALLLNGCATEIEWPRRQALDSPRWPQPRRGHRCPRAGEPILRERTGQLSGVQITAMSNSFEGRVARFLRTVKNCGLRRPRYSPDIVPPPLNSSMIRLPGGAWMATIVPLHLILRWESWNSRCSPNCNRPAWPRRQTFPPIRTQELPSSTTAHSRADSQPDRPLVIHRGEGAAMDIKPIAWFDAPWYR